MSKTLNRDEFFKKFNITEEVFEKTALSWDELMLIYDDYCNNLHNLESIATSIFNMLMKAKEVHSVRYRVKEPEHVIEKIIRKQIENSSRVITVDNYQVELTDLIGIRILHLFKEQWLDIHKFIQETWDSDSPVANYREGDRADYLRDFENQKCELKKHPAGYRSVHYIIKTSPTKKLHFVEIQVRTIFEEAWSEIDHKIRYPYDQNNIIFGQLLSILNRFAGGADEIGSYVLQLKEFVRQQELDYKQNLSKIIAENDQIHKAEKEEKDKIILKLKLDLKKSKLSATEKESMNKSIVQLETSLSKPPDSLNPKVSNMSSGLLTLLNGLSGNSNSIAQMLSDAFEKQKSDAQALLGISNKFNEAFKAMSNPPAIGAAQDALKNAMRGLNINQNANCSECGRFFTKVNVTDDNICDKCRENTPL